MRSLFRAAGILLLCWAICWQSLQALAETGANDSKHVLQKGLDLYEIDRELARIQLQESRLQAQLNEIEQRIRQQEEETRKTREHAGLVLRAYYMGDRDAVWLLLFSISSFSDMLTTLEYLSMIVINDHLALQKHADQAKQLTQSRAELLKTRLELGQLKSQYLIQKEQMTALQKELEAEIANQDQPELVQQQISTLTADWRDKGVPLFRQYFQALSEAMKQLPELAASNGGKNANFTMNGFNYTFQITDRELNDFLRKKNDLFNNLTFRFTPNHVIAEGKQESITASIKGHYSFDPDKSKNKIRFLVDELQFNGFQLPQTTIDALEQEFDLGIYPQNLVSFLQVTGLTMEEGKLSIQLKFSL
jgi:hypothetical protein